MQTTINAQTSPLTKGAQIVLDTFQNPRAFFDFMTEVLSWVNVYEVKHQVPEGKSIHFSLIIILREIGFKWMQSEKGAEHLEIAEGIFSLIDSVDPVTLENINYTVSKARAEYCNSISITKEAYDSDSNGLFALLKLKEAMENFEYETKLNK